MRGKGVVCSVKISLGGVEISSSDPTKRGKGPVIFEQFLGCAISSPFRNFLVVLNQQSWL